MCGQNTFLGEIGVDGGFDVTAAGYDVALAIAPISIEHYFPHAVGRGTTVVLPLEQKRRWLFCLMGSLCKLMKV